MTGTLFDSALITTFFLSVVPEKITWDVVLHINQFTDKTNQKPAKSPIYLSTKER